MLPAEPRKAIVATTFWACLDIEASSRTQNPDLVDCIFQTEGSFTHQSFLDPERQSKQAIPYSESQHALKTRPAAGEHGVHNMSSYFQRI
jgi:hypothetical protein